jgi:hypothetical protein
VEIQLPQCCARGRRPEEADLATPVVAHMQVEVEAAVMAASINKVRMV